MSKIKLTLRGRDNQSCVVDGWSFEVPNFTELRLAVHHPWGLAKGWRVSEISTGLSAGSSHTMTTKKNAIEAALDRYKGISEETKQRAREQIVKVLTKQQEDCPENGQITPTR